MILLKLVLSQSTNSAPIANAILEKNFAGDWDHSTKITRNDEGMYNIDLEGLLPWVGSENRTARISGITFPAGVGYAPKYFEGWAQDDTNFVIETGDGSQLQDDCLKETVITIEAFYPIA